jgi:hypothetical protein
MTGERYGRSHSEKRALEGELAKKLNVKRGNRCKGKRISTLISSKSRWSGTEASSMGRNPSANPRS